MTRRMNQKRLSQEGRFWNIICQSSLINTILTKADELALSDWHLCAGCLTLSVWNSIFQLPDEHGIDDINLIYFDTANLSDEAEEN